MTNDERSGLPLLLIYSAFVIAGVSMAMALLMNWKTGYADVIFIILLGAALILTWPCALRVEGKFASRGTP